MGIRAVLFLALVGCGRLGFDPGNAPEPPPIDAVPAVCAPNQWTTLNLPVGLDMAAMATPAGVAITWADTTAGSAISGALLDHSNQLSVVNPVKTGTYISSSLSYVDGVVASAEVEPSLGIKYDTAQADLTGASEFACPTASIAPKPAVLHAGPDIVALSGFDNGLTVWPIVGWSQQASQLQVVTNPVTAMAAAEVGSTAAVVWSTADACHVELLTDAAHGVHTTSSAPCSSPRLASDGASVELAYETPTGIAVARGTMAGFDPGTPAITIPGASSPRVVHDGTRYWISYLDDASGSIVAATTNDLQQVVTTFVGHVPQHGAYDLAVLDGQIWIIAVDAEGLAADRICLR